MFKRSWEHTCIAQPLSDQIIKKMLNLGYPEHRVFSCELLPGGYANLNFKINFDEEKSPVVLRIYLRDKVAAYREKKLAELLKPTVPLPFVYYNSKVEGYTFSILEYIPGISLRNFLFTHHGNDIGNIMAKVGKVLATISAHQFGRVGELNKHQEVIPFTPTSIKEYAYACLQEQSVLTALDPAIIKKIRQNLTYYSDQFPKDDQTQLVHGDFNPSNILVDKIDNEWAVSGILDWEFAFSGSSLWDVANMLRYAHKMPPIFQSSFLTALEENDRKLPRNWQITVNLLNLTALLDLLKRTDLEKQPNRCADICDLISYIQSGLKIPR